MLWNLSPGMIGAGSVEVALDEAWEPPADESRAPAPPTEPSSSGLPSPHFHEPALVALRAVERQHAGSARPSGRGCRLQRVIERRRPEDTISSTLAPRSTSVPASGSVPITRPLATWLLAQETRCALKPAASSRRAAGSAAARQRPGSAAAHPAGTRSSCDPSGAVEEEGGVPSGFPESVGGKLAWSGGRRNPTDPAAQFRPVPWFVPEKGEGDDADQDGQHGGNRDGPGRQQRRWSMLPSTVVGAAPSRPSGSTR